MSNILSDDESLIILEEDIYNMGFGINISRRDRVNIMNMLFQNALQGVFELEDEYSEINDRMMEIATRESLYEYKTQEKKPNIKLDIESHLATAENKEDNCSICNSEVLIGETITTLECKHIYHTSCIGEWVMYKPECPCCRTFIKTIDEYDVTLNSN